MRRETLNGDLVFDVTGRVRRRRSIEPSLKKGRRMSGEEYEMKFGASPKDISRVEAFAHEHHLAIVESDMARRSVILRGKAKDFENAFKVHLSSYHDSSGRVFHGRGGSILIPKALQPIVEGVFGLDARPHARPMFQVADDDGEFLNHASAPGSFRPNDLSALYGFPKKASGKGQSIGIIWTARRKSFNEACKAASVLEVSICVAAGDAGSSDSAHAGKAHVDFPAASPSVRSCGGTRLIVQGKKIESETLWHASATSATGGGVSEFFPLPSYQKNANVPPSLNSGF